MVINPPSERCDDSQDDQSRSAQEIMIQRIGLPRSASQVGSKRKEEMPDLLRFIDLKSMQIVPEIRSRKPAEWFGS